MRLDDEEYRARECPSGNSIAFMILEGGRELILPYNSKYLREKPLFFPEELLKAKQLFGFPFITEETTFGVIGFISLYDHPLRENSIGVLRDVSVLLSFYYKSLWVKKYMENVKDIEPVTGALLFPAFLQSLEKTIQKGTKFSLLSIKLPALSLYNKNMGLEFTNDLLNKVAQIIRYCVGDRPLITRKGGGHFYVLLKDSEMIDVKNTLKIMHHAIIKSIPRDIATDNEPIAESGLSYFPEDTQNIWELFDKADAPQFNKY